MGTTGSKATVGGGGVTRATEEALKQAVKSGNVSSVKQLLDSHPNLLSWRDARGWSCLHWATSFGSTDIVKCLQTEYHMDPLDTANDGSNSLHIAAGNGQFFVVKYYIEECKMDPQTAYEDGWNTLHCASISDSIEIVKYLVVVHKMDPKTVTKDGSDSIHIAAVTGQFIVVKYYIEECKMDPQTVDEDGWNTLHRASESGSLEIVKYLVLVHKMDPKTVKKDGVNSLHIAAYNGQFIVVKYYIEECKMDPQTVNENGWNTLHYASASGSLEIVKYLMMVHKMDPKTVKKDGVNSLHIAAYNGQFIVVKYYIEECKMDPQTVNEYGWNTLHYASVSGSLEIVKYLVVVHKMDPKTVSKFGSNSLHIAAVNGQFNVVKYYIEECKVDPQTVSKYGKTALDLAKEKNHLQILEYLSHSPVNKHIWFQEYENAVKRRASVIVNLVHCLLIGPPYVGKSSLKYLLANNESKIIQQSTGPLERPEVLTVTSETYLVDDSIWKLVTDAEMGESVRKAIQDTSYDAKETLPVITVTSDSQTSTTVTATVQDLPPASTDQSHLHTDRQSQASINPQSPKSTSLTKIKYSSEKNQISPDDLTIVHESNQPIDPISSLVQEYKLFVKRTNKGQLELENKTFVHLLDTGGQPVFQDALPFLLNLPATYINVFNASKDLRQPIEVTYRPDSQTTQSVPSSQSGLEMMQYLLSSVYTMSFKRPHLPEGVTPPGFRIFMVGTFKDKIMEADNSETILQDIENHMKRLSSKPYFKNIVQADKSVAFLINNLMCLPGSVSCSSEEKQSINKLRSLISTDKGHFKVKMPLAWLLLKTFTSSISQKVFRFEDFKNLCCQCNCIDQNGADGQFKALLGLFHMLGLYAYFELKEVPQEKNWICTDVTFLYKELAKILTVEFNSNLHCLTSKKFQASGIVRFDDHLNLFEEVGVSEDVPTEWLLQVLHSLGLSAKVRSDPDVYFMPIVLPFGNTEIPQDSAVDNLCFAFDYKDHSLSEDLLDIPRGIFCKLAVYLINRKPGGIPKYKACPGASDKVTVKFTRNNLELYLLERPGRIEAALFCKEYFLPNAKSASRIKALHEECTSLRTDLEEGIKTSCKALLGEAFLDAVHLQVGFLCECGKDNSHLAAVKSGSFLCSLSEDLRPLYEKRRLWMEPVVNCSLQPLSSGYLVIKDVKATTKSSPSTNISSADVVQILGYKVEASWRHFGVHLGVDCFVLEAIELHKHSHPKNCLSSVVEKWLAFADGTGEKERSWEMILQAVKVAYSGVVYDEIKERIEQHHSPAT